MTTHGQDTSGGGVDAGSLGPFSVAEASDRLGVSVAAVRKRAQRLADGRDVSGLTRAEHDASGEWQLWLEPEAVEAVEDDEPDPAGDLAAELRARIATLEAALERERENADRWQRAHEREQVLLGQAQQRVLELEDSQSESRPWWRRMFERE